MAPVVVKRKTYTIDANGKVLGRLATKIAVVLMGKNKPDYAPHKDIGDFVMVKSASGLKFTGKKFEKKVYYHHTGYLGGLKEVTLKRFFEKDPTRVLRKAVYGMLPTNKLRSLRIKRLKFVR